MTNSKEIERYFSEFFAFNAHLCYLPSKFIFSRNYFQTIFGVMTVKDKSFLENIDTENHTLFNVPYEIVEGTKWWFKIEFK